MINNQNIRNESCGCVRKLQIDSHWIFAKRYHFICMHKQIYGATEKNKRERGWPVAAENVDQSSNQISRQSFARWMRLPFPFIIVRLLLTIIIITTLLNYRFDFVQITRKISACLRWVHLQWVRSTQSRLFALLSICLAVCVWFAFRSAVKNGNHHHHYSSFSSLLCVNRIDRVSSW